MSVTGELRSRNPQQGLHEMILGGKLTESHDRSILEFDPAKDISERDWEEIERYIHELRRGTTAISDWQTWLVKMPRLAMNVAVLSPERAKKIFTPIYWENFADTLDKLRSRNEWQHFSETVFFLAHLYPDKISTLVRESDWEDIEKTIAGYRSDMSKPHKWNAITKLLANLYIVSPVRVNKLLAEIDWDKFGEECTDIVATKNPVEFANIIYRLSNLPPEKGHWLLHYSANADIIANYLCQRLDELRKSRIDHWQVLAILSAVSRFSPSDAKKLIKDTNPELFARVLQEDRSKFNWDGVLFESRNLTFLSRQLDKLREYQEPPPEKRPERKKFN